MAQRRAEGKAKGGGKNGWKGSGYKGCGKEEKEMGKEKEKDKKEKERVRTKEKAKERTKIKGPKVPLQIIARQKRVPVELVGLSASNSKVALARLETIASSST